MGTVTLFSLSFCSHDPLASPCSHIALSQLLVVSQGRLRPLGGSALTQEPSHSIAQRCTLLLRIQPEECRECSSVSIRSRWVCAFQLTWDNSVNLNGVWALTAFPFLLCSLMLALNSCAAACWVGHEAGAAPTAPGVPWSRPGQGIPPTAPEQTDSCVQCVFNWYLQCKRMFLLGRGLNPSLS